MKTQTATYSKIADEYYQAEYHPTCAVLRQASLALLERAVIPTKSHSKILEVGCGRSFFCETFADAFKGSLWLLDESREMMDHSMGLGKLNPQYVVRSACDTGLPNDCFDLIVSSLGDPYNDDLFWREAERLLAPGGLIAFTTPSYDWSTSYRTMADDLHHEAVFELINGEVVRTPSYICPVDEQIALMQREGLVVTLVESIQKGELDCSKAPKTQLLEDDSPLVTLFVARSIL